jgi:hypothetical protein
MLRVNALQSEPFLTLRIPIMIGWFQGKLNIDEAPVGPLSRAISQVRSHGQPKAVPDRVGL